jgi:hypothetical protein
LVSLCSIDISISISLSSSPSRCVTRVPLAVLLAAVKGAVYWKVHPVGHLHLNVSQVSVGVRDRLNPVPARTIKLFALGNLLRLAHGQRGTGTRLRTGERGRGWGGARRSGRAKPRRRRRRQGCIRRRRRRRRDTRGGCRCSSCRCQSQILSNLTHLILGLTSFCDFLS